MEFIKTYQLSLMQAFSGICAAMIVMLLFTKAMTARRKWILIHVELTALLLVSFDRLAYIYAGDISRTGYVMVRLSNLIVFVMTSEFVLAINLYVADLLKTEGKLEHLPKRSMLVTILSSAGMALAVISHFTGLYYTFDASNRYHRGPGFLICYILPVVAPLILLTIVLQYRNCFSRKILTSLVLFILCPVVASIIQIFAYGLSLTNMVIVIVSMILYIFAYLDINDKIDVAAEIERKFLRGQTKVAQRLFEQTATAFVNAIDAKDEYSRGHSTRVAKYAKMIAEGADKSEEECEKIYFAALLHDVGKLEIPENILLKKGKLSEAEYEVIKAHSKLGEEILSSIVDYPYLSIAAKHHHERYDGKGYPDKLKGDDIPEIARIIAVADAYDAMTSDRSYREAKQQQIVREEIVKGTGTQFDPKFAKIMLHLIDLDSEFEMKEKLEVKELAGKTELECGEYRSEISEGIVLTSNITRMRLRSKSRGSSPELKYIPTIILFDSLDGRVHDEERTMEELNYFEYCEIWFDGHAVATGARSIKTTVTPNGNGASGENRRAVSDETEYSVEAVKVKDHVLVRINDGVQTAEIIVALPDSVRYAYMALTGEQCLISDVSISKDEEAVSDDYIPRIAEEISYIDRLEGDVPNVQINGYRMDSTAGIPVTDGLQIDFHTMSLPTARLIWHTAFLVVYHSDDGLVTGDNYKEYALVRLDGENWEAGGRADNKLMVNIRDDFEGWDAWKEQNKKGMECSVNFERSGNRIVLVTENFGVYIRNTLTVTDGEKDVYVCLTGDQCALTDIRIRD